MYATPAAQTLKEEHKAIERVLKIIVVACQTLEKGEELSPEIFKKILDFMKTFADRCHHKKEEDILFPIIERSGIPREGGPTGVILKEHEQGRRFARAMAEAVEKYEKGDKDIRRAIIENARGYIRLLSSHILKEDAILYPLAEEILGPLDQKELMEKFGMVEKEDIGEGTHHGYIRLVAELEKELNIS